MAWIESHTDLLDHPKTKCLKVTMGWDLDTTIGKLHRFWWWCLKYAEDGDLRRFNDAQLADAVGLNGDSAKNFINNMVEAGFIDREPFFRVHDWIDRVERYLVSKYHTSNPKKIKSIVGKHRKTRRSSYRSTSGHPLVSPPNLTNLTLPNQPDLLIPFVDFEKSTVSQWNSFCGKFPILSKIEKLSDSRRKRLKVRFQEKQFRDFGSILKKIEDQPFLYTPKNDGSKHGKWVISFDWLIANDTNYLKVLEERYADPNKESKRFSKFM